LIHLRPDIQAKAPAGNQSPIPFDTLRPRRARGSHGWESITNPL